VIDDAPRVLGRTAIGLAVAGAVLWGMGLDPVHALVLGAALVALIALRKSPAVNNDQAWPDEVDSRSDTGVRREVARLSWSMQGYESRVQRQSVGRLHQIAVYRLGELGLDLDDPRDYLACESALGVRAYQVVSEPEVRPLYPDFVAAVGAVEKLSAGQQAPGAGSEPGHARPAERA
jgi:hypothetical protein